MIMTDIDYFKNVNDTFGHLVGDEVLKEFAKLLQEFIDEIPGAIVGRWGGEEFFAALPGVDEKGILEYGEKLRKTAEQYKYNATNGKLTISVGVITTDGNAKYEDIINKVDNCLYDAKVEGRNCVVQYKE
jgi:diguanylate cyclase (GGDEF)-like protein